MTNDDRNLRGAAVLIHEQLATRPAADILRCLPEYSLAAAVRLRRLIKRAQERGWHRAARRLLEDLTGTLRRCRIELETALHLVESAEVSLPIPTPLEIYGDLVALRQEFDELEIHSACHEIRVTTDTIVLEDVNLGRFQICLDWRQLATPPAYRIVALDPNPAAANEEVTHPHVQIEKLCEGEGRAAIEAARAQGRLYDLFLLISQLLHTYGRGSAFVELDAWDGITCDACGAQVREEDRYSCSRCGDTLREGCSTSCAGCEETHCCGCLTTCPECDEDFCRSCLATCPRCRRRVCDQCREDDLCRTCHEEQSQEEEDHALETTNHEDQATPEGERPETPAEPHRLGEALVPA